MDNPIQVDLGRIAQDLQIRRVQVESVVQLLDDGNSVPFITRYRKERTGNLNEVAIREIQLRVQRLRDLAERKETILKAIDAQGKLNPDLAAAIRAADGPKRLEDLYLPFKPKKRTKASDARERGLEPLAFRIWTRDETLTDLTAAAQEFVNTEAGVESVEKVLEGVGHILAEAISEMALVRDGVRKVVWKTGKIVTGKGEIPEGQGLEYRDYFDYSEPVSQIPPHRVLAINRGDKEGPLKVRLDVSRADVEAALFSQLPLEGHPHVELFRAAAIDALDRLILPSMEREVRRDLTEAAEKHAVEVFARNLRSLLLQPPIPNQIVMAIDPGFRTGCKVAVLDPGGNLLDHGVVYPHAPQNRRFDSKVFIKDLVGKYKVGVVAVGNGTACRETEELIAEIIAEGTRFSEPGAEHAAEQPVAAASPASPASVTEPTGTTPTDGLESEKCSTGSSADSHPAQAAAEHTDPGTNHEDATGQPSHAEAEVACHSPYSTAAAPEAPDQYHAAAAPEPSLEDLPPISGGAPESSSPETEIDAPPSSPPETASEATAIVLSESQEVINHSPHHEMDDPPAGVDPDTKPAETASSDPIEAGQSSGDEPSAPAESAQATSVTGQAELDTAGPVESVPAPGTSETAVAPAPTPLPVRQGKSGDQRKQQRSRPPRVKQPPPAPTPPQPHPADRLVAQLAYVVVNEAGASVYSTSQVGRDELPDSDATLRSGISIGRRLQDPLSELVKIEPQNIGVGLYQHDVNPKQLKDTLDSVISSCVNFVGVDLNTASVSLLRHVSGLNQLTARRIVDYRKEHGPFINREQLKQVEGIGPATYTQAAGFLKISGGDHPLDRTWVHPESYSAATKLLEKVEFSPDAVRDKDRLSELRAKLSEVSVPDLAKELEIGEFSLRDIIDALGRPERDPREDLPKPIFKKGVLKIEDLTAGMELKGTVLNVVDFGAFVDIGLKDSGLVHISQLANRYVKSPHDVVSVGDVVTVWVMGVDHERKRVSLTMVKPGTERVRGPQGNPRRGDGDTKDREGRGQGQGRRGGGPGGPGVNRPPRPTGSALTSPPVGAPSVAALAEPQPRRQDRERSGPSGALHSSDSRGHPSGPQSGPAQNEGSPHRHGYGPGPGPPGRGGHRGPHPGRGPGRPDRHDAGPGPRPPSRPHRPSPPPPPLSEEARAGKTPLRTFGQLKQLWETRSDLPPGQEAGAAESASEPSGNPTTPNANPPQPDPSPADSAS
ncbi:MAG: helix-hairpin-helix domain-containing protein [Isosphaeraceae bacterium]